MTLYKEEVLYSFRDKLADRFEAVRDVMGKKILKYTNKCRKCII